MTQSRKPNSACPDGKGGAWRGVAAFVSISCLAVLVAAPMAFAVGARGPDAPARFRFVERPEEDVLLLALKLDQSLLVDTLSTYQDRGEILVPLGEFCRLIGLGIIVDVTNGAASGFIINDARLFSLDVASGKVVVEGQQKPFDASGVEVHQDDIYVSTSLVSEWLPLHLDVDLYGSLITVRPREKLPLQLRLEREQKMKKSVARQGLDRPRYPRLEVPYRLFDGPFIDQTLRLRRQPRAGGGGTNGLQFSTYATGDVLFMEANGFVSGTEEGIADSRFSLGRKDPEANLLGFLHAREVTIGDVFHPGVDLVAQPSSGPGFLVSNFPLQLPALFDRQSFRGDLPPGWEVELYRGDELLAYSQSRPDGLYEFLDVPLLFGLNLFRLEFYGPQGQQRTETKTNNVGETLTPPGQLYYRLAGDDPGARLLGTAPAGAKPRASFELSGGLSRNLSVSGSVSTLELADGRHVYGKAGLRGYWSWLFSNIDFAADRAGGSVIQGTLQSRLGAFGFFLQHAELHNFVGERFPAAAGSLRSRSTLRLNSAIPETFLPRIPVIIEVRQNRFESGESTSDVTARLSTFSRGLSVSNQVSWNRTSGGVATSDDRAFGQLLVSKFLQRFALRGQIEYDLKPTRELTAVAVTAESRAVNGFLVSTGLNRAIRSGQTRYFVGANKLEGAFGFGVTAEYSSPGGFGASVALSIGIGHDSRNGKWHTQARALAGAGAASARAFLDANGNRRMDPGERPIPGAGFLLSGSGSSSRTGEDGEVFIPNLSAYQPLDLAPATSTLEDPYWKPALDGVRFVPRPGRVAVVDFPIQVSGEITGTVFLKVEETSRAAGRVELRLTDSKGSVVQTAKSSYDGFYDMTEIRPGRYTLSVVPPGIAPPRNAGGLSRDVVMTPAGTVLEGVDFVIEAEPTVSSPPVSPPVSPPASPSASPPASPPVSPQPIPGPRLDEKPGSTISVLDPPVRTTPSAPPPVASIRSAEWNGRVPIFAVQLGSYRDRDNALRSARALKAKLGQPCNVLEVDLGPAGLWFRVVAGEFATADAARAFRLELTNARRLETGPVYRVEGLR